MTRPVKRTIQRRCANCQMIFSVSRRNARKQFCSNRCRWRMHNGLRFSPSDGKASKNSQTSSDWLNAHSEWVSNPMCQRN